MHRIQSLAFDYNGYQLAIEQHGERGEAIILVHGILLDAYVNRDIAQALVSAGYKVFLLDLLGHGRSATSTDATLYRVDFFAEQVIAAMDHLQLDTAILGGLSLGTITALQVATQAPERISAMLLEMPVMEHATPAAALMLVPVLLAARYAAPLYRPIAQAIGKLPRPKTNVWHSLVNAIVRDPEVTSAILHGTLVGPVVPPARKRREIQIPTLVIGHLGDWLHPFVDARALAQDLPNAQFLKANSILELRTRPQRLMPQIVAFLQGAVAAHSRPKRAHTKRKANSK